MDVLLLALTVAPGLAIALFVYLKDKFDPEPFRQLVWAFFWGIVCTLPAMLLNYSIDSAGLSRTSDELGTFLYAFVTVALAEEFCKFLALKLFYHRPFFDEPFDGITYAVMIGMGFATFENVIYVFFSGGGGFATALVRMLTAIPAHASFAVIMGYFMGLAKFKSPGRRIGYQFLGLFGAVFFHGTYDFLLMLQNYPYISIGAIGALVVSLLLSFRAMKLHQQNSPFRNGALV